MVTKDIVMAAIAGVKDPEIGLGVVDLGLVYDVIPGDKNDITIFMTLTTPACPYGPQLIESIKKTAKGLKGVDKVNVELIWDPPWNPEEMASDYAKDILGIW